MVPRRRRSLRSLVTSFTAGTFILFAVSVSGGGFVMYRTWRTAEEAASGGATAWVSAALARRARNMQEGAEARAFSGEAAAVVRDARSTAAQAQLVREERGFLERHRYERFLLFDHRRVMRFGWTASGRDTSSPDFPRALFDRMDADGAIGGYWSVGREIIRVGASPLRDKAGRRTSGYVVLTAPVSADFLASFNEGLTRPIHLSLVPLEGLAAATLASADSLVVLEPLDDILGRPAAVVRVAMDQRAENLRLRRGMAFVVIVLLVGALASWLAWYRGQRLLVTPLLQTVRDVEAMRDSASVRELSADLPIAEWDVLRSAFNDRVRALSEFQRRYRDVFDRAADALFLLEPGTGRVIDANPATTALTGLDAAAMIGQTLASDLVPDGPGQRVVRWRRPDGVSQTWGVAASTIAFDGGTWTLAAYRDLTGREVIAHAQKMEAVGSLAGGIAHDFNNLMGAVLTGVAAARTLVGVGHPALAALDGVAHAGTRAAELTRQLLSFSRHDPLRLEAVDIAHAIETVDSICRRTFEPRIVIDTFTAPDVPAVLGDAGEIEQALLNLCINARDAMPSGGSLRIEAKRLYFDNAQAHDAALPQAGTYVEISVVDTGAGMSDEVKARLFEPFFTTKEPGHGTGLGLPLVYGLTRQLGGAISVHSVEGQGTHVRLLFPALAERAEAIVTRPAATSVPPRQTPAHTDRPVILLVDDERALREMLRMVLELSGFTVLEAADGTRALAQFGVHRDRIRAILLDVQLPGPFSGVETLERIRSLDADVPVLLCTGFVREDDLARMHQLSVDDVLLKPVDINALLARLDTVCSAPRRLTTS